MKRIIIPAGTVSGKKDYILEIPVDPNDQDNEEDAIYILDDKSSKASFKSLSDYFYDEPPGKQTYKNQYPSMQQQFRANQQSQGYQQQQIPYQQEQIYQNVFPRARTTSNYVLNSPAEYSQFKEHLDGSAQAKYLYYKSLGFSESEIFKMLSRNNEILKKPGSPYPRKYMRFNRLGVSDFYRQNNQPYRMDSLANPNNLPTNNVNTGTYDDMASVETTTSVNLPNNRNNVHQSYEQTDNQPWYDSTPTSYYKMYNAEKTQPRIAARRYQQYELKPNEYNMKPSNYSKGNSFHTNYQLAVPTGNPNSPKYYIRPTGIPQQNQNLYQQSRYYPRSPAASRANSPTRRGAANNPENIQQMERTDTNTRTKAKQSFQNKLNESNNFQKPYNNTTSADDDYPEFPELNDEVHKETFRTLPGTSVVSNPPNVRIKNPNYSDIE
ncbi:hypothetical protein HHI36_007282 [Cryptolaemus montrouzieri]|uniref:Uncharacterized protein n=1 Tax=Cryptolaemus montrouzieri TaxID=559131 RepID=A0ABD2MP78_9CUCU